MSIKTTFNPYISYENLWFKSFREGTLGRICVGPNLFPHKFELYGKCTTSYGNRKPDGSWQVKILSLPFPSRPPSPKWISSDLCQLFSWQTSEEPGGRFGPGKKDPGMYNYCGDPPISTIELLLARPHPQSAPPSCPWLTPTATLIATKWSLGGPLACMWDLWPQCITIAHHCTGLLQP